MVSVFLFATILGGSFAHSLAFADADARTARADSADTTDTRTASLTADGPSAERAVSTPNSGIHEEVPFPETPNLGNNVICHVYGEVNDTNSALPFLPGGGECPSAPVQAPECSDGIDNDHNGLTDYPEDPGCTSSTDDDESGSTPLPPSAPACSDGVDNDNDGFADQNDPNCHIDGNPLNADSYDPSKDDESGTLPVCWNGLDDDGDGAIDMDDADCSQPTDNSEEAGGAPQCSDGVDNDNDGAVDADDPQCHTDGDPNNADSYDPSRNSEQEQQSGGGGGTTPQCSNGLDDDNDGFIDADDPACHTDNNGNNPDSYDPNRNTEEGPLPACWNGTDDDGDGSIDLDDPDCDSALDDSESAESGSGGNDTSGSGAPNNGIGGTIVGLIDLGGGSTVNPADVSCEMYLTQFIRAGQDNDPDQVRRLQYVLKHFEGHDIEINGIYDDATLAAVHAFQTKYAADILEPWGIRSSTGYVYLTTRKKINEIFCNNTKAFPLTEAERNIVSATRARVLALLAAPAYAQERSTATTTEAQEQLPPEIVGTIGRAESTEASGTGAGESGAGAEKDTERLNTQLAGAGAAAGGDEEDAVSLSERLRMLLEKISRALRWSPEAEGVQ